MSHWSALVPKSHQTFRIHPQGRHHIPRCIWCMDETRMRAAKFDQLGRITHTNGIDWHQKNRNKIYFNVLNVPHGLYREAPGKPWRRLYLHCCFFSLRCSGLCGGTVRVNGGRFLYGASMGMYHRGPLSPR